MLLVTGFKRSVLFGLLVLLKLKCRILLEVGLLLICMGVWKRLYTTRISDSNTECGQREGRVGGDRHEVQE
jgi:hypothetical protein